MSTFLFWSNMQLLFDGLITYTLLICSLYNEISESLSVFDLITFDLDIQLFSLFQTSSSSQTKCLPVLNTPKSQFHLRTDSKYLLSQTGINPDHLTFKDDLDLQDLHLKGRLSLTLVDHNVLAGEHASLEDSVVMVIDHHQLERKHCDRSVL